MTTLAMVAAGQFDSAALAPKRGRSIGFTHVRALYITKNLDTDWVDKGFPIETPKHLAAV